MRLDEQENPLKHLYGTIRKYIEDIKSVVDLDVKFYGWIFGVQNRIYAFLINFEGKA